MRYPQPWFPLSDDPSQCSCRTTTDCRPYRSSLSGCRFCSSGSSGFVGGFRRLRLSNCGLSQGVVAVWIGVEIGISAVRFDFLQEVAAVPNKSGFFFEAV